MDVPAFKLARYEVTRGQYAQFIAANPSRDTSGCYILNGKTLGVDQSPSWHAPGFIQDDQHPVTCVSYDDAQAFIAWLNQQSGKNYRLPSEEEWEYAARVDPALPRQWA